MEKIQIISRNENQEKNSERFEQFSKQVERISTKTNDVKEKYGEKTLQCTLLAQIYYPHMSFL